MEDMIPHKYTHHCIHGETHRFDEQLIDAEGSTTVQDALKGDSKQGQIQINDKQNEQSNKNSLREKYLKNIKLFNKQLNKKQQDKQA